ncbi:IclR family transcriptional regulator, partial [Micrococcus endophyticus]
MTAEPARAQADDDVLGPSLHRHPSGVGVVDKSVAILDALESGPATLAQLVT